MVYYNRVYERDVVDMVNNNTQFFRTQPEKTISVEGRSEEHTSEHSQKRQYQ